ncbi:MAG: 2-oxoacid:acceptor oxidoreductase family protein [Candidatus Methanomethylophilaceae archaeon]
MNKEIVWHGRGGQGVVTANEILAETAISEGKYVKAFPEFGPERMGAPIRAFTRISSSPIRVHSQVYYPDIVVVLDPTLIGKVDVLSGLKKDGFLLANYPGTPKELQEALKTDLEVHTVNATKISLEEIGRPVANTAILGALIKTSPLVSYEALQDQISTKFQGKLPEKAIVKNISALERAHKEVQ